MCGQRCADTRGVPDPERDRSRLEGAISGPRKWFLRVQLWSPQPHTGGNRGSHLPWGAGGDSGESCSPQDWDEGLVGGAGEGK